MGDVRRQERRNTAAGWAASTEILREGEIGIWLRNGEPDAIKIGDGVSLPAALPWLVEPRNAATIRNYLAGRPDAGAVIWTGGTAGTPPPNATDGDLWFYNA